MERRRTFSREFKLEAVKLVTERGVAVAQAAKDLDVHENVLLKWVRELRDEPLDHQVPHTQLFVRPRKGEAYRACGPVTLESAEGDRPMSIVRKLQTPLSARLFREFSVLRGV